MAEPLDIALASDRLDHQRAVDQRAAAMRALIEVGATDPRFEHVAEYAAAALFAWAHGAMDYEDDPRGWDTVRTVGAMWDAIEARGTVRGDCMHRATLIGAALVRAGRGCALIFQSFDGVRYAHVLVMNGSGTRFDPQQCARVGDSLSAVAERSYVVSSRRVDHGETVV